MIVIIGRGHSGTRSISHTLSASGVFMGDQLNVSGDLLPPENMYEACRVMAKYVKWQGGLSWDWSQVNQAEIPNEFKDLIYTYLKSVLEYPNEPKGFKIPETTLVFPWFVRMFPDAKYIFWIRDPRDSIIGAHITDDMRDFGIQYPVTEDIRLERAISWKYQYDLVKQTPKPKNWITVKFEDFIMNQDETLARLESYLGFKLAKIEARKESVGRWKTDKETHYYDFFAPSLIEYGYEFPEPIFEQETNNA